MERWIKRRGLVAGAASLMLAACASKPPPATPEPQTPAIRVLDASYDWHGLLVMPFGSVLKDAPFALHEVLLFRDASHAAQGDDAECYAMERPAPKFLKRTPDEYLLCFKHDHLARIEATVRLPSDEAPQMFGDACGLWQRNSGVTPATGASMIASAGASGEGAGAQVAANAAPSTTAPVGASSCEGRDAQVAYSSRLEESGDPGDRALTIRLDTLVQP